MLTLIPPLLAALIPNMALAGDPLTDDDAIIAMVQERMDFSAAEACYAERLADRPSLEGTWVVNFTVATDGTMTDTTVVPLHDPDSALEACIATAVSSWRFEPIHTALPAKKTLTFAPRPPPAQSSTALRIERGTSAIRQPPNGTASIDIADPTVVDLYPMAGNWIRFEGLRVGNTTATLKGPGTLHTWSFDVIEPDLAAAAADPKTVQLLVGETHSFPAGEAVSVAVTEADVADIAPNPANRHIEVTGIASGLTDVFTDYEGRPPKRLLVLVRDAPEGR